ncbi:uncharacterized protein A4U43_C09F6890 [Asparagus officinalis]|uniref:Uncharacterized protein n=1 Tax=Asparagus officinalis TaxID=4686 RepID=A0A5P1E616_ASPOF|nr:uncharacterized protein A4U43_C09F6890 [Asparagus officinalis]
MPFSDLLFPSILQFVAKMIVIMTFTLLSFGPIINDSIGENNKRRKWGLKIPWQCTKQKKGKKTIEEAFVLIRFHFQQQIQKPFCGLQPADVVSFLFNEIESHHLSVFFQKVSAMSMTTFYFSANFT